MPTDREQLLADDAPAGRRRAGALARPVILAVAAAGLFGLLVAVVMNIDSAADDRADGDEIIELIAPGRLSEGDIERGVAGFGPELQPQLRHGGWVQIADPQTGQLRQQYRCDRLDPSPEGMAPGWMEMTGPEMEIYLADGRMVRLTGERAVAQVPHRAVESGTITGDVLLRLYEPDEDGGYLLEEPALIVRTEQASFESFLGEIRCDGWLLIESPRLRLPGHDLRLLVDDVNNRIEMTIREPEYIRLVQGDVVGGPARAAPQAVRHSPPAARRSAPGPVVLPVALQAEARGAAHGAQFYLLTVRDDVRIMQGAADERRVATGDRMEVVFSTESEGLEGALAGLPPLFAATGRPAAARRGPMGPLTVHEFLTASALAAVPPASAGAHLSADDESLLGPDITLIRSAGPLTLVPIDDPARLPPTPADASLTLTGRPVHLRDIEGESEARGSELHYHTAGRRIELLGTGHHPVRVDTPDLRAGGERFHLSEADRAAGFDGAGWMLGRAAAEGSARAKPQAADDSPAGAASEPAFEITWRDGVDLQFDAEAPDGRMGRLLSALFTGAVRVISDELTLDADELTARFPEGEDAESIESITAKGRVRVVGVNDEGAIHCGQLHLDLARTADGRTIPKHMIAEGDVEAIDREHIIWADLLDVMFSDAASADERPGEPRREVEVRRLLAQRDVQVLLADGTRAFAEELRGDGGEETLELLGETVIFVSENRIAEQAERVVLNRITNRATTEGPGVFRIYENTIAEPERSRVPRPQVDPSRNRLEARAEWRESMVFDGAFNDGAGALDLRGDVSVLSTPAPNERNTMTGEALTVEFTRAEERPPNGRPAERRTDEGPYEDDRFSGDAPAERSLVAGEHGRREVSRLIARQDAKLESHLWESEDRDGEPRIFYIAGRHVEYEPPTGEGLVVGAGELLVHDLRPGAGAAEASTGPGRSHPFGRRGTTAITWSRKLEMTQRVDEVYDVVITGDVVMRHRDPDEAVSWLTCERLEATVHRAELPGDDEPRRAQIDMGGSARLDRVNASGGVVIRTGTRTIECDRFDYDVASAIARIHAAPGDEIYITTEGSPAALRATSAVWNLGADTINITGVRGDVEP